MTPEVDFDLSDAATRQALADHAAGRRIDHDAHQRQARTTMNAWREQEAWGAPLRSYVDLVFYEETTSPDAGVDEQLIAMDRLKRDRIEALALLTHRSYRTVLRRRQRLRAWRRVWARTHCDADAPCPPMPALWR